MRRKFVFAMMILASTVFLISIKTQPVRAATQNFHLYGTFVDGWGFTPGGESIPGPTITVNFDDIVNLTLTNENAIVIHQFLLSYHNLSVFQPGDPESSTIPPSATITYQFTANVSGTFTYYCVFHPTVMYGTFIVNPPVPEFNPTLIIWLFVLTALAAVLISKRKGLT